MAEKSGLGAGQHTVTSVELRQPYICSDCGAMWFDRHECPAMPSSTAPGPTQIVINPTITINPTRSIA